MGFGRDMVERYFKRTDNALFVHIKRRKVPKAVEEDPHDEVPEKVSKMAINVPGKANLMILQLICSPLTAF